MDVIKISEGRKILPCLRANELVCHPFMDASRRHENRRPRAKGFIVHGNVDICASPLNLTVHKEGQAMPAQVELQERYPERKEPETFNDFHFFFKFVKIFFHGPECGLAE